MQYENDSLRIGRLLHALLPAVLAMGTMPAWAAAKAYIPDKDFEIVTVIDTATNAVIAELSGGSGHSGIAVHPTGAWVYVTNHWDDSVTVFETGTNLVAATVLVGSGPTGIAVNPAGTFAYVADSFDGTVSVIDTSSNTNAVLIPVGPEPHGVAMHPAGTFVYVTHDTEPGKVSVIDTSTNNVVATIPVGNDPTGIAIHPAGTFVYVTHYVGDPGLVSVIETTTNKVVATVEVGSGPYGLALNPTGSVLYVANDYEGTVSVIATSSNTVIGTLPAGVCTYGLDVHPNGLSLYVMDYCAGNVLVFNTVTSSLIKTVQVSMCPGGLGRFIVECPGHDFDGDGILSGCDKCPFVFDPDQVDTDHDGKGDVCDDDIDNDGCKDAVDEDPSSSAHKTGYYTRPPCIPSSGILFDFAGGDTDGDGLLDCEDPDNENDGIPDGSDACPVTVGTDPASCTYPVPCVQQSLFELCNGGGCEQFFLKLVPTLPDATLEVIYEHIQVVNDDLYVYPIQGATLAQSASTFAPAQGAAGPGAAPQACDPLRLEAWAKEQPGSPAYFVMLVAEYDPCIAVIGPMDRGAVLLVVPPSPIEPSLTVDAVWVAGMFPRSVIYDDADGDEFPDPFDNCEQAANTDQTDTDADRAGDVCDCASTNDSAFAIPAEITGLTFSADHASFTWDSGVPNAGYGTVHDVLRGSLDELPVGSGSSEWCLASDIGTFAADYNLPAAGQGYWYDVRGGNACGNGTYGVASDGTPRESRVCP